MDKLPLPNNRRGWIAALLLTALGFLFYYTVAYAWLVGVYEKQSQFILLEQPYETEGTLLPTGLRIKVAIPKYVSPFERRPILIRLSNDSPRAISHLKLTARFTASGDNFDPSLFAQSQTQSTTLMFTDIEPGATQWGQIAVPATRVSLGQPEFWANGIRLEPRVAPISLQVDNWKAFVLSFVQQILLPPWSNGFIPAAAFFLCWLWGWLWDTTERQLVICLAYIFGIVISAVGVVSLLWLLVSPLNDEGSLGAWIGVLASIALIVIQVVFFYLRRRSPDSVDMSKMLKQTNEHLEILTRIVRDYQPVHADILVEFKTMQQRLDTIGKTLKQGVENTQPQQAKVMEVFGSTALALNNLADLGKQTSSDQANLAKTLRTTNVLLNKIRQAIARPPGEANDKPRDDPKGGDSG